METGLDRRTFLARAAVASGGLMSMGALERLLTRDAFAHGDRAQPYGPLRRTKDQRGVEVLALPAGFSYVTFSHTGSTMSDGNPTPLALDGMGAFANPKRRGHGHGHGHGTDTATGTTTTSSASCATARTATRRERAAACSATAARPTTRPATAAPPHSSSTNAGSDSSRTS